jgi:hypothetical protein
MDSTTSRPSLDKLRDFPAPVVDRAIVERVLRLHRRTAIRLLHRCGGFQAGKTLSDRPAGTLSGGWRRYRCRRQRHGRSRAPRPPRRLTRPHRPPLSPDGPGAARLLSGSPPAFNLKPANSASNLSVPKTFLLHYLLRTPLRPSSTTTPVFRPQSRNNRGSTCASEQRFSALPFWQYTGHPARIWPVSGEKHLQCVWRWSI